MMLKYRIFVVVGCVFLCDGINCIHVSLQERSWDGMVLCPSLTVTHVCLDFSALIGARALWSSSAQRAGSALQAL